MIREDEPARPSAAVSTLKADAASTVTERRRTDQRKLRDLLAGELDWLVMKALDKDRQRRYESASEMADDIERYLRQQPISARPPSTTYRVNEIRPTESSARLGPSVDCRLNPDGRVGCRADRRHYGSGSERQALQARTERQLYASQLVRATAAWEARDYGTLQELLQSTTPQSEAPDLRDWEWHFLNQQARRPFPIVPDKPAYTAAWHPERNEIAVVALASNNEANIEIWEPGNPSSLRTVATLPNIKGWDIQGFTWSGNGNRIALTSKRRAIVLDADTGAIHFDKQVHQGERNNIWIPGVSLSPTQNTLATGSRYGQIKTWDIESGRLVKELFDPPVRENLNSIEFSPDGAYLAATLRFGYRHVWDVTTKERWNYGRVGVGSQGALEWSADGTRFVATDEHTDCRLSMADRSRGRRRAAAHRCL